MAKQREAGADVQVVKSLNRAEVVGQEARRQGKWNLCGPNRSQGRWGDWVQYPRGRVVYVG